MRVALVHDWLTGYRGGEKVLEALCELYPNAPLYTFFHIPGKVPAIIENREIRTSFLNKMPFAQTHYRHYLPLFPLAAETLIDREFDLIISTSHAVAKSIRPGKAKHWCYIHSPMRYVWDRFEDYFGPARVGQLPSWLFFKPLAWLLRLYDRKTADRVHCYVANSQFVANRVKRFYSREAEVIHPPVEVEAYSKIQRNPENHYLFFSALVPYKKCDLAIRACQNSQRKLIIVGDGPELPYLKSIADSKWIEFRNRIPDSELLKLFETSKALIFPAVEDFGIVPVEATAAGLPVVGLSHGGLLDSQTNETCVFFPDQTEGSLIQALDQFEKNPHQYSIDKMRVHASRFSKSRFKQEVQRSISKMLATES